VAPPGTNGGEAPAGAGPTDGSGSA
jgi:hypothetical protein